MTAEAVLNRYYLETRCKIIEIAATLDRMDAGQGPSMRADPRVKKVREAIAALLDDTAGRAERCQLVFSLPYEAEWNAPNAK